MPDMTDDRKVRLLELAGRVAQATGADRELDQAIVEALYPDAMVAFYCVGDDEPVVFHAQPLVPNKAQLPAYTSSLDATLTLFKTIPPSIPTNPRAAVSIALRQIAEAL